MSQQILYQSRHGAVLASDSRIVITKAATKAFGVQQKIYPLGKYGCITSLGAGVGIHLCCQVQTLVESRPTDDFATLRETIVEVLNQGYHRYLVQNYAWIRSHPEAPRLLYFTLVGYNSVTEQVEVLLLESVDNQLPFREISVGQVLTMPRSLSLEAKMLRLQQQSPGLAEVARFCRQALRNIAEVEENVGGPFQSAIVDARGCSFEADT